MNPLSLSARSTPVGLLVGLVLGFGCSSSDAPPPASTPSVDGGATSEASTSTTPSGEGGVTPDPGCPRTANTSDRVRNVVVSHPFTASGGKGTGYEVLHLALDGKLARDGEKFEMGRNFDSPIVFSPDGAIGVSVQDEDGTLGIVRFDEGKPAVVEARFGKDLFYAESAVFSPDGSRVFIVDTNRNTTGGVHEVAIACDGKPTYRGRVLDAPGSGGLDFVPGTQRAALVAASAAGGKQGHNLFVLDLAKGAAIESSIALFPDDKISIWGIRITPDGKLGLVADGNEFMETKRVGVFSLDGSLKKVTELEIDSPSGLAVSPWSNAAVVTAAGGSTIDAIYHLQISSGAAPTVTSNGKLTDLVGGNPQLPTSPVVLTDGTLKGFILVGEVEGVRRLRFDANGSVKDLGVFTLEGGLEAGVGSVGVQP